MEYLLLITVVGKKAMEMAIANAAKFSFAAVTLSKGEHLWPLGNFTLIVAAPAKLLSRSQRAGSTPAKDAIRMNSMKGKAVFWFTCLCII